MQVCVIGAGGVGGYFGGRLAQAGAEVTFVARGAHLDALRRRGLEVHSVLGDFAVRVRATDDPATVSGADHVLVCVKSYDTEAVAPALGSMLAPDGVVVSLQNGVGNEERIAAEVGAQRVAGGAAYIFANLAGPGTVDHTGGPAALVLGEWRGGTSPRIEALVRAFESAGVRAQESSEIRTVLWSKLAFICAQAGVTAAVRLPIGEIRAVPEGRRLFLDLAREACAVAAAEGVALPDDLPETALAMADAAEPGAFSSLHHDLVSGRRLELDALLGEVVARGERHGVPVPVSRALDAVLRPWATRAAASSA